MGMLKEAIYVWAVENAVTGETIALAKTAEAAYSIAREALRDLTESNDELGEWLGELADAYEVFRQRPFLAFRGFFGIDEVYVREIPVYEVIEEGT